MKKTCIALLIIGLCVDLQAQSTIRPSIYFQDMHYYNPAAIDLDSSQQRGITVYAKHKFVDNQEEIWNKPTVFQCTYLARIKKQSYYSLSYVSDQYSFFNRNSVYATYAYQWEWGRFGTLDVGGRLVLNLDRFNWDELQLAGTKTGKSIKMGADIDVGFQYRLKGLIIGFSSKNLANSVIRHDDYILLENHREAYLNASYRFRLGQKFQVAPYTLIYLERRVQPDVGLFISLFDRVALSYQLRITELRSMYMADVRLFRGIRMGTALDHSPVLGDINLDLFLKIYF